MTIAVFELLENLEDKERNCLVSMLNSSFEYNKLFTIIKDNNLGNIDFHLLLSFLKSFNVTLNYDDNIFKRIEELRDNDDVNKLYRKERKSHPTILSLIRLITRLKNTSSPRMKYEYLYIFFKSCSDLEIKWTVNCLLNLGKMKKLIE